MSRAFLLTTAWTLVGSHCLLAQASGPVAADSAVLAGLDSTIEQAELRERGKK